MSLFAISDLHLSFNSNKSMDIFGENWVNHFEKIKKNWIRLISKDDTVLLCGDFSWAMNLDEVKLDLDWLNTLPGTKILIKGNHDFWWSSINKLNSLYPNIKFIQNNYIPFNDYAICGSRGYGLDICENEDPEHHLKILEREKIRMTLSLDSALKDGYKKFIYMFHYPPFTVNINCKNKDMFLDLIDKYNIEKILYGHIHSNFDNFYDRKLNNTSYYLTSCDYLNFTPLKIL